MKLEPQTFLTSESLARRLDLPGGFVRDAVLNGTVQPDGQCQAGRRMLVLFKPSSLETIKLALCGKSQIVA